LEEVTFAVDATALYAVYRRPSRKPAAAVLLVHGFNSNVQEFGHLQERLADAGIASLAFDQRGFGGSGGPPGRTSATRSFQDIQAAAAQLQARAPGVPLGVVGHSLGGAWSLHALVQGMPFRAAVVAHAPDRILGDLDVARSTLLRLLGPASTRNEARGRPPKLMHYKSRADYLFVSREHQRKWARPDVLIRPMNLANVHDFAHTQSSEWASQVHVPVLTVVSEPDKVVRRASTMKVHEALPGPKRLLEHRGGHACFRDLDGDVINAAIVDWFTRHLGGAAPP